MRSDLKVFAQEGNLTKTKLVNPLVAKERKGKVRPSECIPAENVLAIEPTSI